MKIIIDAGGTKADWVWISEKGEATTFTTSGYSPLLSSTEVLDNIIRGEIPSLPSSIGEIYYYGSGVINDEMSTKVKNTLVTHIECKHIEVHSDMMAACRATAGNEKSIVSILGTGSASCLYDGVGIEDKIPSLGFIAGDEGAGTKIGKAMLQTYFYREMDDELQSSFESMYETDRSNVLSHIYSKPAANQYLGEFVKFAVKHKSHPVIQDVLVSVFDEYVQRHLLKYKEAEKWPCHFVGSIGWIFEEILSVSIEKHGLQKGIILQKPMERLMAYHMQTQKSSI